MLFLLVYIIFNLFLKLLPLYEPIQEEEETAIKYDDDFKLAIKLKSYALALEENIILQKETDQRIDIQ